MSVNKQPLCVTKEGREDLGRMLKEFREERGLSQRAAADLITKRCGRRFSFTTISAIERGHRNLDVDTLFLLAQSGYGGMSFSEMADVLSDRRLSLCEKSGEYKC